MSWTYGRLISLYWYVLYIYKHIYMCIYIYNFQKYRWLQNHVIQICMCLLVWCFFIDMYTYYICRYRTRYAFTYAISLYKEMQNLLYVRKYLGITKICKDINEPSYMQRWHSITSSVYNLGFNWAAVCRSLCPLPNRENCVNTTYESMMVHLQEVKDHSLCLACNHCLIKGDFWKLMQMLNLEKIQHAGKLELIGKTHSLPWLLPS